MIELHQYPAIWGLPSLSPFCIKVEAFLKKSSLPYRVVVELNPARGPKGKMPFIRDGEKEIADSTFIIDYLIEKYDLDQFREPDPMLRAQALAFQRMIEEYFYFVLLYYRWIDPRGWSIAKRAFATLFPPLVGTAALPVLRVRLTRQARAQGLSRHSHAEICAIGRRDLEGLSDFLADKSYLMGSKWMPVDATLFAFLTTVLKQPIETELKEALRRHANLVSYCQREDAWVNPVGSTGSTQAHTQAHI
jgi:glutathione S-transferase